MSSRAPATTAHPSNKDEESDADSCVAPPPTNSEIIGKLKKKSIAGTMGEMRVKINECVRPLRGEIIRLLRISSPASASEFETLLPTPSLPKK